MLIILCSLLLGTGTSACNPDDSLSPEISEQSDGKDDSGAQNENNDHMKLQISIGSNTFLATLSDNATAKAFSAMLPVTVTMSGHAGNEKYCNLSQSLPVLATNPGTIRNGDIMLFGSSTLVLFYKTFSTSYSYTRIGVVDNPAGLEKALGTGNVTITFKMIL